MADTVTDEQLLAELEDLLRTMPKEATIRHDIDENFGWLGRAAAIIERWSPSKGALFNESLAKFHEIMARPLFIDKKNCCQSGASFKDGAKNAPTTLTQITDAFSAVLETYDKFWSAAKVER